MTAIVLSAALYRASPYFGRVTALLERYGAQLWDLAARLWIAQIFFASGLVKIRDWESTLYLFAEEYKVPILPTEVAATPGTAFELGMPILLTLGLFSRLAALPLIAMTCVIQFVLGASNPDYDNVEHAYWLFLLASIVIRGGGAISLDAALKRFVFRRS